MSSGAENTSAPTAAAVWASKLLEEGVADTTDVALLQRMDSRDILLNDKLFESLPLDDLIRKSDTANIDRLFLGHMKQELWKSVLPKGQQSKQPVPDEKSQQQPLQPKVPTTPSTVASTITSRRGRTRTRLGASANGRGAIIAMNLAKQVNKKLRLGNTNSIQNVEGKGEGSKKEVKEEREEQGANPATAAEPREPSSPGSKPWGDLSFVDGSVVPLATEMSLQKKGKASPPTADAPSKKSIKSNQATDLAEEGVKEIVAAVEAQFAKKFDSIQNTLEKLGSQQQSLVEADRSRSSAPIGDQLSPSKLQTITAAMEDHFAPRFDAIEGSLTSIQHTLATLATTLAQLQLPQSPPPPPIPIPPAQASPQPHSPKQQLKDAQLSPRPYSGSAPRCGLRSPLGSAINEGPTSKTPDVGQEKQQPRSPERGMDKGDAIARTIDALKPITIAETDAAAADDRGNRQPNKGSKATHLFKETAERTRETFASDGQLTKQPNASPMRNFKKLSDETNDLVSTQGSKKDVNNTNELGKSNQSSSKIVSRAKKIMLKTNRVSTTPEATNYSFIKRRNMRRTTAKGSAASRDMSERGDTNRPFSSLSTGNQLLRGRSHEHDAGIEEALKDEPFDAHVHAASALRIRRLQYRPGRAANIPGDVGSLEACERRAGGSLHDNLTDGDLSSLKVSGRATTGDTKNDDAVGGQHSSAGLKAQPPPTDSRSKLSLLSKEESDDRPQEATGENKTKDVPSSTPSGQLTSLLHEDQVDDCYSMRLHDFPAYKAPSHLECIQANIHIDIDVSPGQHQNNSDISQTLLASRRQKTPPVSPPDSSRSHPEDMKVRPQKEHRNHQRRLQMDMNERSPSWNLPTPVSLAEVRHHSSSGNDASAFGERDIPASISLVSDRRRPDDDTQRDNMPQCNASKSSPLPMSQSFRTSPASPMKPLQSTSSKDLNEANYESKLNGKQDLVLLNEQVPLALSSHPSDEEDELMTHETHEEPHCFEDPSKVAHSEQNDKFDSGVDLKDEDVVTNQLHAEEVVDSKLVIHHDVITGNVRSPSSLRSCLTDELGPIRPTKLSQSTSQEVKREDKDRSTGLLDECSFSDISELYPAVQSLPEYLDSPQPIHFRSFSFPLPTSTKVDDATAEYMHATTLHNDNGNQAQEETRRNNAEEDQDFSNGNEARSSQEYASPLNSILATTSSSHHLQTTHPPSAQSVTKDIIEKERLMQSPTTNAGSETAHPSEILLVQEEQLLTPGVSTVSLSVSTARSPSGLTDKECVASPRAKQSPTNLDCCSPSSTLQFLQAERILRDILEKSSKKRSQSMKRQNVAKAKASAGSVVWSNPSHAVKPTSTKQNEELMLPNLDGLPQNNPAFAIIAQKIAEAEAALKAELARDSKPSQFQDDDDFSLEDEKTNMEIFIPNNRHHDPPVRLVRPRSPGPTTTILTDNAANRYVELVHMNSAALFDQPFSPGASARSTGSSSSSENEVVTRTPKVSFLERFQTRTTDQHDESGNYSKARLTKGRTKNPPTTKKPPQQKKKSKSEKKQNNSTKVYDRYVGPSSSSHSSSSGSAEHSSLSVGVGLMDEMHQGDTGEQDAAQIFEIVERYYHYHNRYNAGNPEHFTVSLEERKKEPLDQLLTWTMIAFEEIEKDFLTSFHDKETEDLDLDKTLFGKVKAPEQNEAEDLSDAGKENERQDDYSKRRLASMDPLERVGIFHLADSNTNTGTNSSNTSSSFDEEDESDSTLFTDEEDTHDHTGTATGKSESVSSELYDSHK